MILINGSLIIIIKKLENGIKNVIINDPKTYNSLSFKTINELIKVFKKTR